MELFKIILKNDRVKTYRLIAMLILLINVLLFGWLLYTGVSRTSAATALIILVIYFLLQWNYVKKGKQSYYFNEFLFFVLAFGWMGLEVYWMVALNLVLGILYFLALQKLEFIFSEEGIQRNFFPRKRIAWEELSNIILRDGILTMDYRNNKILQAEAAPPLPFEEAEFNDFARRKLNTDQ